MAKMTVAGNALVVTAGVKLSDIKMVKKYRPEALTLYEGEGKDRTPVFKLGVGASGISNYGAEFDEEARDGSGVAICTILLPTGVEDVTEYISDKFGRAILKLNKLEETLPGIISEIADEKAMIEANITIAQ